MCYNINTIIKGDIARLIISVEDSGIGMKAEDINKIFTKKQEREDNHNLNNNLYNAKRLITLMNGTRRSVWQRSSWLYGEKWCAVNQ